MERQESWTVLASLQFQRLARLALLTAPVPSWRSPASVRTQKDSGE